MATTQRQPRLSFDSLEVFLVTEYSWDDDAAHFQRIGIPRRLTDNQVALALRIHRGQALRYRHDDIPFWSGDKLAARLGVHPCSIWPDFHEHHVELEAFIDEEYHRTCT